MSLSIKHILLLSIVCVLVSCASVPEQSTAVLNYTQSDSDYYAFVNTIRTQQAKPSDYDSLIQVFPLTSLYQPKNSQEQSLKLLSQTYIEKQQWQQCLLTNEKILNVNYTSLTGHYGVAICATEMSNLELGRFHNSILDNLIEAIWRTGNGQTPESPFYITSVNDLYAFIQLHQLVAVGQSLTYVNNLPIQAIKVQNPETNRSFTWYFNVTPQFRRGVIDELER